MVCGRVRKARRTYAIRSVPNPLEFFGYIYCFSSILAGPAFEYSEYDNAISGKAYEKVSDEERRQNRRGGDSGLGRQATFADRFAGERRRVCASVPNAVRTRWRRCCRVSDHMRPAGFYESQAELQQACAYNIFRSTRRRSLSCALICAAV